MTICQPRNFAGVFYLLCPYLLAKIAFRSDTNYKTVGKVDMKRLVDIKELWAKRAEYEGKVVTVKLGKGSGSVGWTDPIRGKIYNTGNVMIDLDGIETREQLNNYIRKCCSDKTGDTIGGGNFEIGIVHGANEDKTVDIPKAPQWCSEKPDIVNIRKDWAEYTLSISKPFWKLRKIELFQVCLIGSYCRYVETDSAEIGYHILETRKYVLMPTGFKYLPIQKKQ